MAPHSPITPTTALAGRLGLLAELSFRLFWFGFFGMRNEKSWYKIEGGDELCAYDIGADITRQHAKTRVRQIQWLKPKSSFPTEEGEKRKI